MKLENYRAGEYVREDGYRAFILSKINYSWSWEDGELNKLLSEASRMIGELNAYSKLIPNADTYIKTLIKIEANKSSKIEEIETKIEENILGAEYSEQERKEKTEEVERLIQAINYGIKEIDKKAQIDTGILREMHKILMQGKKIEENKPGKIRITQNWVGGTNVYDATYVPPPAGEVLECLTDFEKAIDNDLTETPDLVKIAMIHYQFESIHPFIGGNGRIGRLIVPLYLKNKGILEKPCLYISNYLEENKEKYFGMLTKVRTNSDMIGWIKFFLETFIETANREKEILKNLDKLNQEMNKFIEGLSVKTASTKKFLGVLYEKPVVDRDKLCKLTGIKEGTMRNIISAFLEKEYIKIEKNNKNKILTFTKFMEVI